MKLLRSKRNIRQKRTDNLPQTLSRKRIIIFPTRYGLMFTFILLAMLLGSINYNNNLGFILSFLLGSMVLVSVLHTYRNLFGIKIASITAKPAFAGDKCLIEVLALASQPSRTAIGFSFFNGNKTIRDLKTDTNNRIIISIPAGERGIFQPGPLAISTHYPLGLFCSQSRIDPGVQCLIYPRPLSGPSPSSNDSSLNNDQGKRFGPGVGDFTGLRTYQPGDSLQRIHWKTFSRGHGLFVKEFSEHQGEAVIFDWNRLADMDAEHKLSLLCSMVLKAHNRNICYGVRLPGKTIGPNSGISHKHICLKALALYGLPIDDQ